MKNNKKITPLDVAKFIGVESEYLDMLIEKDLDETYNDFINSEVNFIDGELSNDECIMD